MERTSGQRQCRASDVMWSAKRRLKARLHFNQTGSSGTPLTGCYGICMLERPTLVTDLGVPKLPHPCSH